MLSNGNMKPTSLVCASNFGNVGNCECDDSRRNIHTGNNWRKTDIINTRINFLTCHRFVWRLCYLLSKKNGHGDFDEIGYINTTPIENFRIYQMHLFHGGEDNFCIQCGNCPPDSFAFQQICRRHAVNKNGKLTGEWLIHFDR